MRKGMTAILFIGQNLSIQATMLIQMTRSPGEKPRGGDLPPTMYQDIDLQCAEGRQRVPEVMHRRAHLREESLHRNEDVP